MSSLNTVVGYPVTSFLAAQSDLSSNPVFDRLLDRLSIATLQSWA